LLLRLRRRGRDAAAADFARTQAAAGAAAERLALLRQATADQDAAARRTILAGGDIPALDAYRCNVGRLRREAGRCARELARSGEALARHRRSLWDALRLCRAAQVLVGRSERLHRQRLAAADTVELDQLAAWWAAHGRHWSVT